MNFAVPMGRLNICLTRLFVNQADGKQKHDLKKIKMNKPMKYACPKCGSKTCEVGEIRTASSFLTKIFNIQNKRFSSVTCSQCSYTEFYKISSKKIGDVLDFLIGT